MKRGQPLWAQGASCLAAALLCSAGARAEPEPVAIAVDYVAPPGCPDRGDLLARVRRRNPRLYDRDGAEPSRLYRVRIEPAEGDMSGSLEQFALGSKRELRAPNCARLVDALALVLAVSAEPVDPPEGEGAGAAPERGRAAREGGGAVGGLGAIARLHAAPAALVGPSVEGEWALSNLGVSAGVALRGGAGVGENVLWYEAAPRACLSGASGLGACLGFSAGVVDVRGVEYTGRQSPLWLAPSLALRYRVRVAGSVWAQLALEGDVPLLRRTYDVKETGDRFVSPRIAPSLSLTILSRILGADDERKAHHRGPIRGGNVARPGHPPSRGRARSPRRRVPHRRGVSPAAPPRGRRRRRRRRGSEGVRDVRAPHRRRQRGV